MFDHVVQASEAFRESAHHMQGSLRMVLKGCPECRTTHMIASPSLGACEDCGSAMIALPR